MTALTYAIRRQNYAAMMSLFTFGASVNYPHTVIQSPLAAAVEAGIESWFIYLLIDAGAVV